MAKAYYYFHFMSPLSKTITVFIQSLGLFGDFILNNSQVDLLHSYLNFSDKNSAMLQLMHRDYSYTNIHNCL